MIIEFINLYIISGANIQQVLIHNNNIIKCNKLCINTCCKTRAQHILYFDKKLKFTMNSIYVLYNINNKMKQSYINVKTLLNKNNFKKYYSAPALSIQTYCTYCSKAFDCKTYPKLCKCCNNTTFRNPIPVAVGLLPFRASSGKTGLLLVERNIKPFIGGLAFPGGFIDWNESWREAISREIFEETSVVTDPDEFSLVNLESTPDNTRVLIFGVSNKIRTGHDLSNFKSGNETSNIIIGSSHTELCFSLHQSVFNKWHMENKS